jgi:hypothetical protein
MQSRQKGHSQAVSAAKSGISIRSGRRIDQGQWSGQTERHWRTRTDPLEAVWLSDLVPLLQRAPDLTGLTLLEYLDDTYPGQYEESVLRTLQRRVKHWRAVNGPDKDVIFRQAAEPGRQGLSDFTHPNTVITIRGQVFKHLLYQFRLAFSGWRYVQPVQGGESYSALSESLQNALHLLGGCPSEHRTDSLSAAFNNQMHLFRSQYEGLCHHYGMEPSRNNPGQSHENGAIEAPHGSFKRRLSQALKVRGSTDFDSVDDYQGFINRVTSRLNKRIKSKLSSESNHLQPLPIHHFADYTELVVTVTRTSTIEVRRVLYTVPSRLIGNRLRVHLYHDRLSAYLGSDLVVTLLRVYAKAKSRARCVNYHHVIHALSAKPQAFRYSQLRDDLLPNDRYRQLWQYVDQHLSARQACKWMVGVLRLASDYDCEERLIDYLEAQIARDSLQELKLLQAKFLPSDNRSLVLVDQHQLADYDSLLVANDTDIQKTSGDRECLIK